MVTTVTMESIQKKLQELMILSVKVDGMMMEGRNVPRTTPSSRPVQPQDGSLDFDLKTYYSNKQH